jgi:tRNA A-37 threonylcarbamoyl transferase component Bud32
VGGYRVVREIGTGGMGTVWLAEHVALGRRAALKMLHPEFSVKPDIVQRFFNEAKAATAINDPGIVQVFDFGVHDNGAAYLVMELLEGEPLHARLARMRRMAIPDALRVARQVASTLGAAHERGIVHRDVKPENIFLVRDAEVAGGERAKLLDFGIAKLSGNSGGLKTNTQAVLGTPTFMSPEQCRGAGHVDQRSDVYSLGCVLFSLVVGRPPFEADGAGELIAMHLREPAPLASHRVLGIPPEVDRIIALCLAKDPAQRFASGGELAIALGAQLGSAPQQRSAVSNGPIAALVAPTVAPTTLSGATGASVAMPARRTRIAIAIAAGAAIVIAGVVAIAVSGSHGKPAPTTASTPAPSVTSVPQPAAARPDDAATVTAHHIAALLAGFADWAKTHAGAPCPAVDDVADAETRVDGWGHAMAVTCTDQPGDQVAGVRSAGADGAMGTADDVTSWSLGRDVTGAVAGPRWTGAAASPVPAPVPLPVPATTATTKPTTTKPATTKPVATTKPPHVVKPTSASGVELDENGMPVSR